ncbi:MAG: hypothetical protein K0S45_2002 [Nitrospira sp.]|jgi:hypothetical protein|nr:hypothetical protein [Nitrospira sp.]
MSRIKGLCEGFYPWLMCEEHSEYCHSEEELTQGKGRMVLAAKTDAYNQARGGATMMM